MPKFVSTGSAASKALRDYLVQQEVQRRTQMLDALAAGSERFRQAQILEQAQRQAQNNGATTNTGGSVHPDGTPHVPGDNCACHGGTAP